MVNGGNSDDYSYEYCGLSSNPIGESRTNGRPFTLWGFRSKSSRRHSQGQIEPTISNGDYASMHQPHPLIGGFQACGSICFLTRKTNELISLDQVDPRKCCGITPKSKLRQRANNPFHFT